MPLAVNGEDDIAVALEAGKQQASAGDLLITPHAELLTATVEAVCKGRLNPGAGSDALVLQCRRAVVEAMGEAAMLDVAAVIGMFSECTASTPSMPCELTYTHSVRNT
jgi:hypothetical protein